MNTVILSVGDELVLGQTLDTNSAWISQQLAAVGVDIHSHATVGDVQSDIEAAIRSAAGVADVVLISGGIGPTDDDLTRQALAAVLGQPLELSAAWSDHLTAWFAKLGRVMPESNRIQAMIPRGAEMIWNHNGTAAGVAASIKHGPRNVRVFCMPGVPKEMTSMFTRDVLPKLADAGGGGVILQKTIHTFGAGESTVAERLGTLMKRGANPSVGTTVAGGVVSVRVNARFPTQDAAQRELTRVRDQVHAALGDLIYGEDSDTLPTVVADQVRSILASGTQVLLATAESCTGGLLAKYLTDISGSSAYYGHGWVTYANQAKVDQLGVTPAVIESAGAVSEPVAKAMAVGARERAGATHALAITGIAGPGGGTEAKPVGTVWIALADQSGVDARRFIFPGDRDTIRDRSAKMALTMLRFRLLRKPLPF